MLTLTAVSGWLGPQLSGLLAPFPIIATVLATFTHAQRGPDELLALLRGLVERLRRVRAVLLHAGGLAAPLGTAAAFALATALALLTQGVVLVLMRLSAAPRGYPSTGAPHGRYPPPLRPALPPPSRSGRQALARELVADAVAQLGEARGLVERSAR